MTIDTLFGPEEVADPKPRSIKFRTIKAVYETMTVKDKIADYLTPSTRYTSPTQIFEVFSFLQDETKESFCTAHLDGKNRIVCLEVVSIGTLNQSLVSPREVFKTALLSNAAAIILIHTESRLTLVIEALSRLADDTDTDKYRRLERLEAEQERLQREIEAIHQGPLRVLPHATALERVGEAITLADGLAGDFRRVRDQFEQLNRDLREKILGNEGSRGEVLDSLFAGLPAYRHHLVGPGPFLPEQTGPRRHTGSAPLAQGQFQQ